MKQFRDGLSGSSKSGPDDASKAITQLRVLICGDRDGGHEPSSEAQVLVSNECYGSDFLLFAISNLPRLSFEAKRDFCMLFNSLVRRQLGERNPTVEYLSRTPAALDRLIELYADEAGDLATTTGAMVRECCRYEPLVRAILAGQAFWGLFTYVESVKFDVATDAFSSFRDLLTVHKDAVAHFLDANYEKFFDQYYCAKLLKSENFVTKRQSLKLLGELLLDRSNYSVMTKFISSSAKMKQVMMLLRDKSRPIQYEAFHVFKVFVANPNKPQSIIDILINNREVMVMFLEQFQNDRTEEEQFKEEKAFLIKQIKSL